MFARPRIFSALAGVLLACGPAAPPAEPAPEPAAAPTELAEPPDEPAIAVEPEAAELVPSSHDVLMLVVHEEPLLPSEQRLLDVLEARLSRRNDLELRDATAEEAALATAHWSRQPAPEAPPTFGRASRVLFLRVPAPRRLSDGNRATRGFSGALLLRPPSLEPAIAVDIDEISSWRATDERWVGWLAEILREPEAT